MSVPSSVSDVSDAWLSGALGQAVTVRSTERIGEPYGLASKLYRIAVQGSDIGSVVAKLWPTSGLGGETEVHFYRILGDDSHARLPRCFHAGLDDERGVLILEDLRGRQGDVLIPEDDASLEAIARQLGLFHAQWWGHPRLAELRWLSDGTVPRGTDWVRDRRERFSDRHGPLSSSLANQLIAHADAALRLGGHRLSALPVTLAHGDLHLDNVLFVDGEPIILDWARCRRGPAPADVTALVFGMGAPGSLDRLVGAYRDTLLDGGVEVPAGDLEAAMGGAVLWSFVYWTLGTALWAPADERETAMQRRHIDDAVRMVEFWAERDPTVFEQAISTAG